MNRLQLVQRLHSEIARGSSLEGGVPTVTTGQTGQALQLVNWIDRAWEHIQNRHRFWRWAMKWAQPTIPVNTFKVDLSSSLITDFRNWVPTYYQADKSHPYVLLQPSDQVNNPIRARYRPQGTMLLEYHVLGFAVAGDTGVTIRPGRPAEFTFLDDEKTIVFPVKLEVAMDLLIRYQKTPQALTGDTTTPDMPARHHMAIVYKAAQYFCELKNDWSSAGAFKKLYNEAFHDLTIDQLSGGVNLPGEDRD